MLECLDGHFEHQTLLRIDVVGLARGDTEEFGVEPGVVGEERTPACGPRHGLRGLRGSVVECLPPVVGDCGHRRASGRQEVPQLVRAVDIARQPAAEPDDGDRFGQRGGTTLGGAGRFGLGMGQRMRQTGDRRVLPDVDWRDRASQQLGEFTGQHHTVARPDAQIVEGDVDGDLVGTAADSGNEVVDQPVA